MVARPIHITNTILEISQKFLQLHFFEFWLVLRTEKKLRYIGCPNIYGQTTVVNRGRQFEQLLPRTFSKQKLCFLFLVIKMLTKHNTNVVFQFYFMYQKNFCIYQKGIKFWIPYKKYQLVKKLFNSVILSKWDTFGKYFLNIAETKKG